MPATPASDSALHALEGYLRRKGLKMTAQRKALVRAALAHDGHFTALDVHQRLRTASDRVSLATIYRTLALLEEAGLLQGHDFADGHRRYERALTREHHDHVICLDCRAVVEFHDPSIEQLQQRVLAERGFEEVHHALTIFASCRQWRETGTCPRRTPAHGEAPKPRLRKGRA